MITRDIAMVKSNFERVSHVDAVALGLARYFTGKPCRRGHVAQRATVNYTCVECAKAIARKRIDKRRAYMKGWIAANPDKITAGNKRRYPKEREARIAYILAYQRLFPDRVNMNNRLWRKANPGKVNAQTARRRAARIKATPPWLTADQRREIRDLYELAAIVGMQVDHRVPLRGQNVCGLHVPWNLQLLSGRDNARKGNRHAA
jgi:hypothetical protein